jgi:hypothetical protein
VAVLLPHNLSRPIAMTEQTGSSVGLVSAVVVTTSTGLVGGSIGMISSWCMDLVGADDVGLAVPPTIPLLGLSVGLAVGMMLCARR